MVPLAGIEPALLAELDFEFERVYQFRHRGFRMPAREASVTKRAEYSGRLFPVNPRTVVRAGAPDGPNTAKTPAKTLRCERACLDSANRPG